jgi:hypothetical protein
LVVALVGDLSITSILGVVTLEMGGGAGKGRRWIGKALEREHRRDVVAENGQGRATVLAKYEYNMANGVLYSYPYCVLPEA